MKTLIMFTMLLMLLSAMPGRAQDPPPPKDKNFYLRINKSDEFNGTAIDANKWMSCNFRYWGSSSPHWPCYYGTNIQDFDDTAYCKVGNGFLNLKAEFKGNPDCPYQYFTGGIQSADTNYYYGYFEISALLPGYYRNGKANGKGYWPCFWTYNQKHIYLGPPPGVLCYTFHDEIDILEPDGVAYQNANVNGVGWWDEDGDCTLSKHGIESVASPTPMFLSEHKYSALWLKDRIIFYFDDVPFNVTYDSLTYPSGRPQYVVIDLQVDGDFLPYPDDPTQFMRVNYFHYYELEYDCCEDAVISTTAQLQGFDYSVKRRITIGDNVNTISLSNNETYVFRALAEISIKGNFTMPLGSELYLLPTPINNCDISQCASDE